MIAVMGASGRVGGKVAAGLLARGNRVRVLGRAAARLEHLAAQGAEVVVGDARSRDDLGRLFGGAEAALVLLPEDLADPAFVATRAGIAAAVGDALAGAGVPYVVAVSALAAEAGIGPPAGLRAFEQRLASLDRTSVLVLRCGWFMDNLLAGLPLIRERGINGGALDPDALIPMVATADVAAVAVEHLVSRDFSGYTVKALPGPRARTMREATALIGERLALVELPYVQFPPDDVQGVLLAAGLSPEAASLLVEMMVAVNDGRLFGPDDRSGTVHPVADGPQGATTLEAFLNEALTA